MLKHLFIKNFALIQEVNIDFSKGYTVFTGETGSGKSIFLNALFLILGERADYKVIGPDMDKAIVEATFDLAAIDIKRYFENLDIDYEEETIIRREISKQGKSRAFINDIPVQLTTLKEIVGRLIAIHSQYNTLELKNKEYQMFVLDVLADTLQQRKDFELDFSAFMTLTKLLNDKESLLHEQVKNNDYTMFQLQEIVDLQVDSTDFLELEKQLKALENAGEINQLKETIEALFLGDNGMITQLSNLRNSTQRLHQLTDSEEQNLQRIESLFIETKDLANEYSADDQLTISEYEVQELTLKLDRYNAILRKHRLNNQEEILELKQRLQQSVSGNEELAEEIESLKKQIQKDEKLLLNKAKTLHLNRLKPLSEIEKRFQIELAALKLPNTQLTFDINENSTAKKSGCTDLNLLFSANLGIPPVGIENAASGGELSRVMLVIQKLISEKVALPTLFFDEIDTGVSGDVAQKMGTLLKEMGTHMQLFAISHLPQVAAKAEHHYKVEKNVIGDRTLTEINPVLADDRVTEIARLMSGDVVNAAAIENARLLMN